MEGETQEVNQNQIRLWLRRMYRCKWTYTDDLITVTCDGEEFNINPEDLDQKELLMLRKIISDPVQKNKI